MATLRRRMVLEDVRPPGFEPWRGVSLGGWLILEPGPSTPLFEKHPDPKDGEEVRCEWDLMQVLRSTQGEAGAKEVIRQHRESHITKRDFQRIRECGMNAVRLPFGYWVVLGAAEGEPYVGPNLEYIDRALDWAEEYDLQVVLDLHGCPGGESGEAPCGRRQRPAGTWQWTHWRMDQSLEALEVLAIRYRDRRCVTGITVCNEPSNEVPLTRLCQYYDQAADRVRHCGMPESRVAVVLPVFQRPEDKFARRWQAMTGSKHKNFCFDIHCYHCFENEFHGKTMAQHLRHVRLNAEMLRNYPIVVGEWSLSLGNAAWSTCHEMQEGQVYQMFGCAQLEAFKEATHGHFFWNWTERPDNLAWHYQLSYAQGLLSGPPPVLPLWDGTGEDPLEERLHPSPAEPRIFFGDRVYLRVFYGRYMDVYGSSVNARWTDKGKWQEFTFSPATPRTQRREVRSGDLVHVRAHNGTYLAVKGQAIVAVKAPKPSARFVLRILHTDELRHRAVIYLKSKSTGRVLDADAEAEGIFARYPDFGDWQMVAVEKVRSSRHTREKEAPVPKNRKAGAVDLAPMEAPQLPVKKRRLLVKSSSTSSLVVGGGAAGDCEVHLRLSTSSSSFGSWGMSATPTASPSTQGSDV